MNVYEKPLRAPFIKGYVFELMEIGKDYSLEELRQVIRKTHEDRGGLPSEAKDPDKNFGNALFDMKKTGHLESPETGYYRRTNMPVNSIKSEDEAKKGLDAEIEMGSGSEIVYAWYWPIFRDMAEHVGDEHYTMKIGRTANDPNERAKEYQGGSAPQKHKLGFLLRTDHSEVWEHLLHAFLFLHDRLDEEAEGTEYSKTSPNELEAIVSYIKHFNANSLTSNGRTDKELTGKHAVPPQA